VVCIEVSKLLYSPKLGCKIIAPPKPTPKLLAAGPLWTSIACKVANSKSSIAETPFPSVNGISPK